MPFGELTANNYFVMKKRKNYSFVVIALMTAVISFTGCKKDEMLVLSPTSQSLTKDAGSFSINVTSNTSWTASADQAWLTLGTISGEDNGVISVTYQENSTENSRSGNITVITEDGMVQVVSITQSGPSAPTNPLLGTWKYESIEGWYDQFLFNADMTGVYKYVSTDGSVSSLSFKYEYTASSFILTYDDGNIDTFGYTISGSEIEIKFPNGNTYIYFKI